MLINRQSMKKIVFVLNALELMMRLMEGKRVEGVMFIDKNTGKLTFKAYNRLPKVRHKDVLVKKLPWGWVKASVARKKRFTSVPNDITLEEQLAIMDQENELAKRALIEDYIIESV